jgi:G3E family GTPase
MIIEGDHQRAWRADEKRDSKLVFIGRGLPEDVLTSGFSACAA